MSSNEDDKEKVRKLFSVHSQKQIDKSVLTLKKWIKDQQHPEELQDDLWLEQFLLHAKFDIKKSQKNITTFLTELGNNYKLFESLKGPFKLRNEQGLVVSTPTRTPKLERVILIKIFPHNVIDNYVNFERAIQVAALCALIHFHTDYSAASRFVIDFADVKLAHFKALKLPTLFKAKSLIGNIFKARISGVEFLNAPSVIKHVLPLAKMALPAKIFSRVTNHKDLESLWEKVPRSCLPVEYGGAGGTVDDLIDDFDEVLRNNQHLVQKMAGLSKKLFLEEAIRPIQPDFQFLSID